MQQEYIQIAARKHHPPKPGGPPPHLSAVIGWFLDTHLVYQGRAANTVRHYRQILSDLKTWTESEGIIFVNQFTFTTVQEWLISYEARHHTLKGSTKHTMISRIRAFFRAAFDAGRITELPISRWRMPPKGSRAPKVALTVQELADCLALVKERDPAIWTLCRFLAVSGWRISDALDLRWSEIREDFIDRRQIKTGDDLCYPITPEINECLEHERAHLEQSDHVFLSPKGEPWRYSSFYVRLRRGLADFPRRVTPHVFRRTFGTIGAAAQIPARVLQNLLGHRDLKTTQVFYNEVRQEDLARWNQEITSRFSGESVTSVSRKNVSPVLRRIK